MSSARILVVDDDPQIRRVLRTALIAQGYEVADARNGEEAVEKLHDEKPDLVILDMNMPRMNGLETCRSIRTTSDVPIIMLTVRDAESDKVEALDAGADPRRAPAISSARRGNANCPVRRRRDQFQFTASGCAKPRDQADAERIRTSPVLSRAPKRSDLTHEAAAVGVGAGLWR